MIAQVPVADYQHSSLTPAELRVARLSVGWTILRLSRMSSVPASAIYTFERTGVMPYAMHGVRNRVDMLRMTLEKAGVAFLSDAGAFLTGEQRDADVTSAELRVARLSVGWTILRLSCMSSVPASAIYTFERTGVMPYASHGGRNRVDMLRMTLEKAAADILWDGNAYLTGEQSNTDPS